MASAWIVKRSSPTGTRYLVRYRLGGRETSQRGGGSFTTRREAEARQRFIAGELAALRVPDLTIDTAPVETVAQAGERYLATRIDATDNTLRTYRQAFRHLGGLGPGVPGCHEPGARERFGAARASYTTESSNGWVERDPARAHGTCSAVTPQPGHITRRTSHRSTHRTRNTSRCRHRRVDRS